MYAIWLACDQIVHVFRFVNVTVKAREHVQSESPKQMAETNRISTIISTLYLTVIKLSTDPFI